MSSRNDAGAAAALGSLPRTKKPQTSSYRILVSVKIKQKSNKKFITNKVTKYCSREVAALDFLTNLPMKNEQSILATVSSRSAALAFNSIHHHFGKYYHN